MDLTDPTPHLNRFDSYEQACREFRWQIPQRFNIAAYICRRHSDAVTRVALTELKPGGSNTYTFGGLDFLSDKFATVLSESGVARGDSVAVMLPQSAALAIAHLGILKSGGVVVPLAIDLDPALLEQAVLDSNSRAVVLHESIRDIADCLRKALNPASFFVVSDLGAVSSDRDLWADVDQASSDFAYVQTDATSPAFIFYNWLNGNHTGVVHSHASIPGQLPAFEMCNDLE